MKGYFSFVIILSFSLFWTFRDYGKEVVPYEEISSPHLNISNDYCHTNNETFVDGEELTYKVYYNVNFIWISAGTVTFKINKKTDQYHAKAVGRTFSGYDWIFKVRDTFQSVLDANTLLPIRSTRIVNEGKYTKYDHVNYMRNSRLAESIMGSTRTTAEPKIINIDQCVHDILSSLYAMRNTSIQTLKNKEYFKIEMLLDRKKYPISLQYKGIEKQKKIKGLGNFDTFVFEPSLIAGNIFTEESKMKIWVSQDQNKVPLLIESPIAVGKIKAVLTDHKRLKYETSGY